MLYEFKFDFNIFIFASSSLSSSFEKIYQVFDFKHKAILAKHICFKNVNLQLNEARLLQSYIVTFTFSACTFFFHSVLFRFFTLPSFSSYFVFLSFQMFFLFSLFFSFLLFLFQISCYGVKIGVVNMLPKHIKRMYQEYLLAQFLFYFLGVKIVD